MRFLLAETREEISEILEDYRPPATTASDEVDARPTLLAAVPDGLLLHRLAGPSLSLEGLAAAEAAGHSPNERVC